MEKNTLNQSIRSLRILGVVSVLVAGLIFLWQGFFDWDSFTRFMALSGINVGLGGLGLFCARVWNEAKGARTFLALATAGIAAQFAQAGGILYDSLSPGAVSEPSGLVDFFSGMALSPLHLGLALLVLALTAIPISRLTFKVFSGSESRGFGVIFLAHGALLLVPFRTTTFMLAGLFLAGLHLCYMFSSGKLRIGRSWTFEKGLGLLLAVSPVILHVLHGSMYIDNLSLFIGGVLTLVTGVCTVFGSSFKKNGKETLRPVIDGGLLMVGSLAWTFTIAGFLTEVFSAVIVEFVVFSSLLGFYHFLRKKNLVAKTVTEPLSLIVCIFQICFFLCHSGFVASALGAAVGGILALSALSDRNAKLFKFALICVASALVKLSILSMTLVNLFNVFNLAIIGIVIVVIASLLERKASTLGALQSRMKARLRDPAEP